MFPEGSRLPKGRSPRTPRRINAFPARGAEARKWVAAHLGKLTPLKRPARVKTPHWTARYGVAVFSALVATTLTLLLWERVLNRNPFALFYAAVMLAAWYGGLGPGMMATACSVWAIDTFLLPSFVTAFPGSQEIIQIAIFGGVALLISSLNATREHAIRERDNFIALEQSARQEAERARRRSALLADASNVLGASLDSPSAIGAVAERTVPDFADWCIVDVSESDGAGTFRRMVLAHADIVRRDGAAHLLREYDLSTNAGGVARVISTGAPEVVPRVNRDALADLAGREASMSAFVELEAASYIIAPLYARGRTIGALSLISCDSQRMYGPQDLRLAEDLGHRLAFALDNARLYRDAQDANRMKDEFLAVVSHELRTPLNAILGWAQLLHQGALDEPSVAQGMSAIERNARSQARIIDDVLDVSRVIQGKLRLELKPTAMRSVIEDAMDVVNPTAAARRIRLNATLCIPGVDHVNGDAERLRQVAWNLLSNAIKFTPEGGRVDITLMPDEAAGQVVLCVRDTGKGIEPRFLPHVFERFRQADSSSTRSHGGLGLGLAIVRHLVELHGGTVRAESDGPGSGATFTVRLPASAAEMQTVEPAPILPASSSAPAAPATLAGLHVLLVEDEADARDLFHSVLKRHGAEVVAVDSARTALAAFRHRRPDLLLSDIGMPGEDGYDLIRAVRALEGDATHPTPAMAITAFARAEDRSRALRAGYQMHVPKPIGSDQFATAVATLARTIGVPALKPENQIDPLSPLSPRPLPL